jgi:hypothetical protein
VRKLRSLFLFIGLMFLPGRPCVAQTVTPSPETGVTPNTLVLYRADLLAGKETAYEQTESEIVRSYESAKIPVYWVALQSVTNSPHVLYFDGFDLFADIERSGTALAQGLEEHPEIATLQQKLLDSVSSARTVLAFRRDDLGYRLNKIDLAKSRFVRVSTFQFRPGFEEEFADAIRARAKGYEISDIDAPWMVYQVHSGLALPTFVEFQPMDSLSDIDDALDRPKRGRHGLTDPRQLPSQKWMKDAEFHAEVEVYNVSSTMSHWAPQEAAAAAIRERPAASKNGAGAPPSTPSPAAPSWCCALSPLRRAAMAKADDESQRE